MKELLIQALDAAYAKMERGIPSTKEVTKSVSIEDVNPMDLIEFMNKNQIPINAYFSICACLSYTVTVPNSESDNLKYRKKIFCSFAWPAVYELLTANGYKRVGFNSGLLRQFDDTTVYEMYMEKDWDRLVKYYSLAIKGDCYVH